jgi:hypothetical protein
MSTVTSKDAILNLATTRQREIIRHQFSEDEMHDMNCWGIIVEKFQAMYPYIDQKEKKKIPDVLKQYIETDL